jgi:catechol 2,3-dioxygenase-like lactoylglutathione lyase family enzyme
MAAHPPVPRLRALRHVALRTTAYEESLRFYTQEWGLERVDNGEDQGQAYLRGTGPEHHVLALHRSDYNGIDHISFAVQTPKDVEAWADHVQREGFRIVVDPERRPQALGGGYGVRFLDLEGRVIEVSAEVASVAPRSVDQPIPYKLAHVVLNTTDIDAACAFYTEYLGFKISDWSEHQMVFLRCNRDHHNVAFNQGPWTSPNHVAYELPSVDHYMRGIGRLKHAGIEPLWGPGRHGPGNNTFAYFSDPAGLVPEYTSEVLEIDDEEYLPRVWNRVADQSDLWGTAGPPSENTRDHMAGTPDPGPYAVDEEKVKVSAGVDQG